MRDGTATSSDGRPTMPVLKSCRKSAVVCGSTGILCAPVSFVCRIGAITDQVAFYVDSSVHATRFAALLRVFA